MYSDYRLDNSKFLQKGVVSPHSHANMLTFDANKILSEKEDPRANMVGRQVDREMRKMQEQSSI